MEIKTKIPKESAKILGSWLMNLTRITPFPMFLSIFAPLVSSVFLVLQYWFFSKIIASIVIDGLSVIDLYEYLILFLLFYFTRVTISYIGDLSGIFASENIKLRVRSLLFSHLCALGPQWSKDQISGELAASIIEQVEILDGFFSKYIPVVISAVIIPISLSIFILFFDKIVGIILLITIPLIPLFMALIGFGAEEASRNHLESFSRLSGFFVDRVRGLDTLKLYGREEIELNSLKKVCDDLKNRTMIVLKIAFMSSAVLEFFSALGVASVALYIGLNFLGFLHTNPVNLDLRIGLFLLLIAPEIYFPLRQMALHYHDRAAARAASFHINKIFNGLPNLYDINSVYEESISFDNNIYQIKSDNKNGMALKVENFSFSYTNDSNLILRDINFNINPGDHICLVGSSGVGKTSLLESLAGLRNYNGNVYLDNYDLKKIPNQYLRKKTCLIGQSPYIFADTIFANIMIGNSSASNKELLYAAEKSLVLEFANNFRDGMYTKLGKNGRGLSRGQIQRISIARLFLRNPDLILLDEPTAHLDSETESYLIDEIISFAKDKTLLLVTHSKYVSDKFSNRWLLKNDGLENI